MQIAKRYYSPGIRALLFDAPSRRDFVILEEYLWQEELKESNLGDLLKELWKKHVDQAHNETIATIRIDERVEKLVQDVHPQLGDFDNVRFCVCIDADLI